MKKVAIAAAVAGVFATSATAAELSTFIYQDYALDFGDSSTGNSYVGIADAGSNMVNFNYSDDLGNGLGLIGSFSMTARGADAGTQGNNAAVTSNTNTTEAQTATGIMNRNSFIGLTGEFGKITFGTHELMNELEAILRNGWDANYQIGGDALAITQVYTGAAASGQTGYTARQSQAIEWTSKDMNGLMFNVGHVEGGAASAAVDQSGTEFNVAYSTGALKLSAGGGSHSDWGGTAGDGMDFTRASFTYDAGVVSVAGTVTSVEYTDASDSNKTYEQAGRHINVTMPTASGRIIANMSGQSDRRERGVSVANSGFSGWDVGYMHDASANTKMYIQFNSRSVDAGFDKAQAKSDTENLLLGMRYVY
jgi:hypothetical protein